MEARAEQFKPDLAQARYVSPLLGKPVRDEHGATIARLRDIIVRLNVGAGAGGYPPMHGLVVRGEVGGEAINFYVPISAVAALVAEGDQTGVNLNGEELSRKPFVRREDEMLLAKDLIDKRVIDLNNRKVERVNDALIGPHSNHYHLVAIEVGNGGLFRRLHAKALGRALHARDEILDWQQVDFFASGASGVKLNLRHERTAQMDPVELADLLEEVSYKEGAEIISALDDETAAETLEELPTSRQSDIMELLEAERAADILEEMSPDEATDLIADLDQNRAENLLNLMDAEEAGEVRDLLVYGEHTAGGMMTTDYITVPQQTLVRDVVPTIRNALEQFYEVYYLYVVENAGSEMLVGIVTLRDLLLAAPDVPLNAVMERDFEYARPRDSERDAARKIADYNLLALPVLDERGCIVGNITVDDAIEVIMPGNWRRRRGSLRDEG
jgi:magnesium transporter